MNDKGQPAANTRFHCVSGVSLRSEWQVGSNHVSIRRKAFQVESHHRQRPQGRHKLVLLKEQSQDGTSLEDKGEREKSGSGEGCGWRMLGR